MWAVILFTVITYEINDKINLFFQESVISSFGAFYSKYFNQIDHKDSIAV